MELPDFAEAIPMKLDYILFDACLMGGIEVAYELRGKCSLLGFSQTEVLAEGLDYKTLTQHLLQKEKPYPEGVCADYFTQYDIQSGVYLLALQDNRIFTALDADDAVAEGHSLLVTVGDAGSITILSYALPENQTQAVIKDGSGAEIGRVTLDYVTSITAPAGSVVEIPLGHGLRLVEIY